MIKLIWLIKTADAQEYNLTSGIFVAKKVKILNGTVDQLLGIPYADIPLPFHKSTEANWRPNTVRQANKWSPWCYQPFIFHNSFYGNLRIPHDYDLSLDCLSINLYLPENKERKNLSAIFYIHGGSNAAGGSSFIDGSALASIGNVIVAVPNYRLDVLGFFNKLTLNSKSKYTGNYGLWDQITALKWLYNNCENLGCDKNSIVLLGHSAGAADSLILALSEHSQKYIKRIIMQSGSALSHWSFTYDHYVLEKVKAIDSTEQKMTLDHLDFKSYKSIKSLNDTLSNFISVTTCNLTRKYGCLKEKIKNVTMLIYGDSIEEISEKIVLEYFKNLLNKLDFYQLLNVLGYFQRILLVNKNSFFVKNFYSQEEIIEFSFKSSNDSDNLFSSFMNRNNQNLHSDSENAAQNSTCYMDLALLIANPDIISIVCKIFDLFDSNEILFSSKIIKYVLSCFRFYYNNNTPLDYLDSYLIFNVDETLKEFEECVNQGTLIYKNLNQQGQIDDVSNFTLNYTQKDYCFLTKNSNFLYKPSTDQDLIKSSPHHQLATDAYFNSNIDLLIGLTTNESFYFLLHSYDMNEMIKHAFIHSSMINQTENLIEKLINLNKKKELGLCLKRSLVNFYHIQMSDEELRKNSLKGKLDALELMSDFDFRLSVISQLKLHLDTNATNKIYAYVYSHVSSFNYLLDRLKNFYDEYKEALVKLDNSVTPHFSELDFVFGLPILSKENLIPKNAGLEYNYTQQEIELSISIIENWANFAKNG